jgi:hypothetical protein
MHGVPEFGYALLKELGAPKSPVIETFAEVHFKDAAGKTVIPDGAIVCRRGNKSWTCLVEVKTGAARLKDDQVASYLAIARANGFDGVLTISTQITRDSTESPVAIAGHRPTGVKLWHLSWWKVLTEAVVQQRYRRISDADREWVLRELIHYLSSEGSGAVGFEDMGEHWVSVRRDAREGILRAGDAPVRDVAERWEQFTHYLSLSLTQELGANVTVLRPKDQATPARLDELVKSVVGAGELFSSLRIHDAAGPLEIRANLKSRQTSTSIKIDAPREGGAKARFNWLLRQLREAPDELVVEAAFPKVRSTTVARLADVRDDPAALYYASESKHAPRAFALTLTKPMGQKRGRDEGSFVRATAAQTVGFYRDIVQKLKAWQAPAPKLRVAPEAGSADGSSDGIAPPWQEAPSEEAGELASSDTT